MTFALSGPQNPVCILLATHNGAAYLPEQLSSFAEQTHANWSLRCGDDQSTDATVDLLQDFARQSPQHGITISEGPGRGPAANFLSLLVQAARAEPEAVVAFSDQDDVWLPAKLERAMTWMDQAGAGHGRMLAWVCRTVLTDAALTPLGESRLFPRKPSFGNALMQNILPGNTIVLSPAAAQAVARTAKAALAAGVPYHDWWIYQVITGIGGSIHTEPEPLVLYRQHGGNHLGHHGPVRGRLKRLEIVAKKDYSGWLDANLTALRQNQHMLTNAARVQLRGLMLARQSSRTALATSLPKLGLHRQSATGDQALRAMALAGVL